MNAITLAVLALATWRLSVMLVREAGPFFIFKKIRELTGITHDPDGNVLRVPDTFFAGLLSCIWCTSVWVGAILTLAFYFFADITFWGSTVFSLSAGAIAYDRLFDRSGIR